MNKLITLFTILILLTHCNTQFKTPHSNKFIGVIAEKGMVVSAREEASKIGVEIMQQGGNAFDAMIATDLALLVSYPVAGNIGGGGFMVFRMKDGTIGSLDFREKAPLAASKHMYLDEDRNVNPETSTLGALAVGVPGTIAGLFEVHKKFGSLPFEQLINPAIELATNGVIVTKKQAERLNRNKQNFRQANNRTIFLDKNWQEGDTIKYPKLVETLERIKANGRDEFYKGKTASILINQVQKLGGIITKEDLASYKVKWRDPITFTYKNHKIISMPPPSSGGICLAQILKSIAPFNIKQYEHNLTKYIQLIVEAERRAFADRAYFLGDPDFVNIPVERLISEDYINKRMLDFNWGKATSSSALTRGSIPGYESEETTHYSIVDPFGNSLAVTTTLNAAYGSKVYIEDCGFFLNNEMDDFSIKPGHPNSYGLVGAEANSIAPQKRMLSSMSPTIIESDGKLKMVLGSPGGSTIITSVAQTILNVIEFDMTMQESVTKTRFHHQWLPDNIKFETSFDTLAFNSLQKLGYTIDHSNSPIIGKVDAILVMPDGRLEGGADPRGDDTAVGF